MSQLLSRIRKPLICKSILVSISFVVWWSSSMPIYPYMLLDYMLKLASSGKHSSDGRISIGKHSRSEQKHIVIKDLALVNEVRNAMTPI
uniref:Uncharacterized protein n=1 Tax=Brassica campestris TaxID=3711 RepID=A0A3P6B2T1_BRACM|nr:unnamed protein product [Brassica rapa]